MNRNHRCNDSTFQLVQMSPILQSLPLKPNFRSYQILLLNVSTTAYILLFYHKFNSLITLNTRNPCVVMWMLFSAFTNTFLKRAFIGFPRLPKAQAGRVRTSAQPKGRQPRGNIKMGLNKVGKKREYVKSQERSGCDAHFHSIWREFLPHRLQSTPICPEA